jgi:hypothetical protein
MEGLKYVFQNRRILCHRVVEKTIAYSSGSNAAEGPDQN